MDVFIRSTSHEERGGTGVEIFIMIMGTMTMGKGVGVGWRSTLHHMLAVIVNVPKWSGFTCSVSFSAYQMKACSHVTGPQAVWVRCVSCVGCMQIKTPSTHQHALGRMGNTQRASSAGTVVLICYGGWCLTPLSSRILPQEKNHCTHIGKKKAPRGKDAWLRDGDSLEIHQKLWEGNVCHCSPHILQSSVHCNGSNATGGH